MQPGHYHMVIWIDHREARIFHVSRRDGAERHVLHPDRPTKHIHHKANSIGSGHAPVDHAYLEAVSAGVGEAVALLIVGPGTAKTELSSYIQEHHPRLAKAIVGVEALDHPSDAEIIAMAKKYFKSSDRMQSQTSA